tara:strand:- start:130 stop:357 length:228 start_codon:yes stop_codon:yes gene_type:complete
MPVRAEICEVGAVIISVVPSGYVTELFRQTATVSVDVKAGITVTMVVTTESQPETETRFEVCVVFPVMTSDVPSG